MSTVINPCGRDELIEAIDSAVFHVRLVGDWSGRDLSDLDLSYANLRDVKLQHADMSGTNMYEADLQGGDLTGTDLTETNLSAANLSGTHLSEFGAIPAGVHAAAWVPDGGEPCFLISPAPDRIYGSLGCYTVEKSTCNQLAELIAGNFATEEYKPQRVLDTLVAVRDFLEGVER